MDALDQCLFISGQMGKRKTTHTMLSNITSRAPHSATRVFRWNQRVSRRFPKGVAAEDARLSLPSVGRCENTVCPSNSIRWLLLGEPRRAGQTSSLSNAALTLCTVRCFCQGQRAGRGEGHDQVANGQEAEARVDQVCGGVSRGRGQLQEEPHRQSKCGLTEVPGTEGLGRQAAPPQKPQGVQASLSTSAREFGGQGEQGGHLPGLRRPPFD